MQICVAITESWLDTELRGLHLGHTLGEKTANIFIWLKKSKDHFIEFFKGSNVLLNLHLHTTTLFQFTFCAVHSKLMGELFLFALRRLSLATATIHLVSFPLASLSIEGHWAMHGDNSAWFQSQSQFRPDFGVQVRVAVNVSGWWLMASCCSQPRQ